MALASAAALLGMGLVGAGAAEARQDGTEDGASAGEETGMDAWRVDPSLTVGFDYSDGDYGERNLEESYAVLVTPALFWGPFSLAFTLPIERVEVQQGRRRCPRSLEPADRLACALDLIGRDVPLVDVDTETNWGLGDVAVDVSATWIPTPLWLPGVTPFAGVKFPTGDVDDGLGTGGYDFTGGLDLSWLVGDVVPFVSGGYTHATDPDDLGVEGFPFASAGLSWQPVSWGGLVVATEWRGEAAAGEGDAQTVSPSFWLDLGRHVQVEPYGRFGVAGSAPDFGAGILVRLAR